MLYLVSMGGDGKSIAVKTIDEEPESLEAGQHVVELEEEPPVIRFIEDDDGNVVPMTEEQRDAEIAEMAIPAAANANRMQRNMLLAQSDWTQMPDSALSDDDKAAWAAYRTLLRDLPTTSAWPMLEASDWPDAP